MLDAPGPETVSHWRKAMKCNHLLFPSIWFLGVFLAASMCSAQMYTVIDLGTLGGTQSNASGINASGQIVGWSLTGTSTVTHAFRTAPNSPINPGSDDLGTPAGASGNVLADGINASGQVAGHSEGFSARAFRTAPNRPINSTTDDLGTLGGDGTVAAGINASGQVVGWSFVGGGGLVEHAFRTAPDKPIDPTTDDLNTREGFGNATGINDTGQVVGWFFDLGFVRAFRTAANSTINADTDDLGSLGGTNSTALGINAFGQVVGWAYTTGNNAIHAFRTAPNSRINSATDDLGTLGGAVSVATGIDTFGQVVGTSTTPGNLATLAFLYSGSAIHDLNSLIPAGTSCVLIGSVAINDGGQVAANGTCSGQHHAVLLTPVYKAIVQPPIHDYGANIFAVNREVPVKFSLTKYDSPTCTLTPATIALTRTAGGVLGPVAESSYLTAANDDSNFRIDSAACQYIFNLRASSLGVGSYRVDISINGVMVGHAVFALQ